MRLKLIEKIVTPDDILRGHVVINSFDILRYPVNIFDIFNVSFQSSASEVFKDRSRPQISTFHLQRSSKNCEQNVLPI